MNMIFVPGKTPDIGTGRRNRANNRELVIQSEILEQKWCFPRPKLPIFCSVERLSSCSRDTRVKKRIREQSACLVSSSSFVNTSIQPKTSNTFRSGMTRSLWDFLRIPSRPPFSRSSKSAIPSNIHRACLMIFIWYFSEQRQQSGWE